MGASALVYFSDESMKKEKGRLSIQGVEAKKAEGGSRKFTFTLTSKTAKERVVFLDAASDDDRLGWVNTIASAGVLFSRRQTQAVQQLAGCLGLDMRLGLLRHRC